GPKPYGVLGITQGVPAPETVAILSAAQFVYFRDSVSLATARAGGVKCPVMEFGPDGAFATDLRDDDKAEAFLHGWGLERGKFLCCIPRYRNTPYWTIHRERAFDPVKQKRNDEMKEHDHAQLRAAIVAVVKQTDLKVLICPEDRTQMALGKEMLYDKLPEDLKDRVVWRQDYWLTDEALSVYVRSAGLFGNEMHSPIMCVGNGVPAIVCRWAEQTSKGNMWKDIVLGVELGDVGLRADELQLGKTGGEHLLDAVVDVGRPEGDLRLGEVPLQQRQHSRRVRDVADVHGLPGGTQHDARRPPLRRAARQDRTEGGHGRGGEEFAS
ncbi:MAG: polysaccharide pyruvyl transferase family protein, partial [Verrucomicrobiota bacterium]